MKINEFNNLWCAKYEKENFTICVLAVDIYEAMEVAMEYFNEILSENKRQGKI